MSLNTLRVGRRHAIGFGYVLLLLLVAIVAIACLQLQRNVAREIATAKASGRPNMETFFAPRIKQTSAKVGKVQQPQEPMVDADDGKALMTDVAGKRKAYVTQQEARFALVMQVDAPHAGAPLAAEVLLAAEAHLALMKSVQYHEAELARAEGNRLQRSTGSASKPLLALLATSAAIVRQDLSTGTKQMASNLQQAASSMEQLTGTVKPSANSAGHAHQRASSEAEAAERGNAVAAQFVATTNDSTASSEKIADIIGVIDGSAFQTSILTLDAAVEAARAGEQGRGFAVVASEVRSLTQRSTAAMEIRDLLGASVEKVEGGSTLVAAADRAMTEIVGSMQRVSDTLDEITAAATEQSHRIGEVIAAIKQLDQMAQQNAALAEQSPAAAKSLKKQAARLSQSVGTFRPERHANDHPAIDRTAGLVTV